MSREDPAEPKGGAETPASFEVAMTELEALVERMEGGRLPLEESLAAVEDGVAHRLGQRGRRGLRPALGRPQREEVP